MSRALGLLLALVLGGCAGAGVRSEEVPTGEIALRWYDEEATRRRRDAVAEVNERGSGSGPGVAVARVDDVSRYVGGLFGVESEDPRSVERRFPGRLVFFDPRTGLLEPVPGARPGGTPADLSGDGEKLLFSQLDGKYRQLYEYRRSTGEIRRVTRGV